MSANLIDRLTALLGPAGLLVSGADTAPYLTDWRGNYTGKAFCVARPASADETAAIVTLARELKHPIVPQGGNTGMVGGGVPDASGNAIVLSTQRLNRIRTIDTTGNTLVAEAGCILANVQQAAEAANRFFPLSLAAEGSCTIGGNISTNAGGTQVVRYGNTREQVLGLEVVLPNGEIWNGLRGLRKDNTGYDLKHLFIGAEGTLGVITAAVLKLAPLPRSRVTALVAVSSPEATLRLFENVRAAFGDRVEGFEYFSRVCLDFVLRHIPGSREPFADAHPWHALIELADTLENAPLLDQLEQVLGPMLDSGLARDAVIASSAAQAAEIWRLREEIAEAQKREGKSIKHDISVPIARLANFIERADAALKQHFPGIRIVNFGHIGDGNLHYNCSMPEGEDNTRIFARAAEVNRVVYDIVSDVGGSISAEHGLGMLKRDENARRKSPVELDAMRAIKRALDPDDFMNPGKVL
jgi:FAD/FMN-containing dehydrogenase